MEGAAIVGAKLVDMYDLALSMQARENGTELKEWSLKDLCILQPIDFGDPSQYASASLTEYEIDCLVWCYVIQRLTAGQVGIDDEQVLSRFKSILILQTAHLYQFRAKLAEKVEGAIQHYLGARNEKIKALQGLMVGKESVNAFLSNDESLHLEPIRAIWHACETAMLPIDSGRCTGSAARWMTWSKDRVDDETAVYIRKSYNNEQLAALERCDNAYARAVRNEMLALRNDLGPKSVDMLYLQEEWGKLVYDPCDAQSAASEIIEWYHEESRRLSEAFMEISREAGKILSMPDVDFITCYKNAFHAMGDAQTSYLERQLVVKCLHQEFKPRLRRPLALQTLAYIEQVQPRSSTGMTACPLATIEELALPEKISALVAVPLMPLYACVAAARADIMGDAARDEHGAGLLSKCQIERLAAEITLQYAYYMKFRQYGTTPKIETASEKLNHDAAITLFTKNLDEANSLYEIDALVTVSKPYINRQVSRWLQPFQTDRYIHNAQAQAWRECLDSARSKALVMLDVSHGTMDIDALRMWRESSLFSENRHEVRAVAVTTSQQLIDGWIAEKVGRAIRP